jgi:hypothetical protein
MERPSQLRLLIVVLLLAAGLGQVAGRGTGSDPPLLALGAR